MREHGVVFEGQGAAERLDGPVGLVLRQRGVAGGDQALELAFLADGVPGHDDPDHQGGKTHGDDQQSFHGGAFILADEGTLAPRRGLSRTGSTLQCQHLSSEVR